MNGNKVLFFIVLCSVALSSGHILYNNIEKTEFNGDETGWISSAYYYTDLLFKLDFSLDKWEGSKYPPLGSAYNSHVGQWLIGIPLKFYSAQNRREFPNIYDFRVKLEENKSKGNVPPKDELSYARKPAVLFGVMCCTLVVIIGYYSKNLLVGMLTAILLMSNQLFITFASRAMTDIYFNFFLLCSCLTIIILARSPQRNNFVLSSFLCGITAGVAASVKIHGIVIIGLLFFVYIIYKHFFIYKEIQRIVFYMLFFSFSAIAVVYLLNPFLWDANHPMKFFTMFGKWNNLLNSQAAEYGSGWGANRLFKFHQNLLFTFSNFSLEWVFLCSGTILFSFNFVSSLCKKKFNLWDIVFLFFLINYVFMLVFMKLNWDRYYLPTIIASKFITAGMIYETLFLYRYFYKSKKA